MVVENAPAPYDISLNGYGLMLARDRYGKPLFSQRSLPFFPERQQQTEISGAMLPPDSEYPWTIDRFHLGLGQYSQPEDPNGRYFYAVNIDARIEGQVILGPKLNTYAPASTGLITDFFEMNGYHYCLAGLYCLVRATDASWTVSKTFGHNAQQAVVFRGTQNLDYAYVALGNGENPWVYDGTTWTQVAMALTPTDIKVTVDNGATYSATPDIDWSSLDTLAKEDWAIIGYSKQFDHIVFDVDHANGNASVMTVQYYSTVSAGWVAVTGMVDGTISAGKTLGADGTVTFSVNWDDWATNAIDGVTAYHVRVSVSATLDGDVTFTSIKVAAHERADCFEVVGNELWRAHDINKVCKCTNGGTTPSWAADITVGDKARAITKLRTLNDRLYIGKTDGFFTLSTDATQIDQDLIPEWHATPGDNNCKGMTVWRNEARIPFGNGLYSYSSAGVLTAMGLDIMTSLTSVGTVVTPVVTPAVGPITALCGDDYYLYAAVKSKTSTATKLFSYGAYRDVAGIQTFAGVWHGELVDCGTAVVSLTSCRMTQDNGTTYIDFTAQAADSGIISPIPATVADGDWIVCGYSADRFAFMDLTILGSPATNVATMTVEYWGTSGGPGWVSVAGLTDGTSVDSKTLSVSGRVSWTAPGADWVANAIDGVTAYHIRVGLSAWVGLQAHINQISLTSGAIQAMKVMTVAAQPRLYMGIGGSIGYIVLSRWANPLLDSNYQYGTSGTLYLPMFTSSFPSLDKLIKAVSVQAKLLSSTQTITGSYLSPAAAPTTTVAFGPAGDTAIDTNPGEKKDLATLIAAKLLNLQFALATSGASQNVATPVLYNTTLHYAIRPILKRKFTFAVKAEENLRTNTGVTVGASASDIIGIVDTAYATSTPVILIDPRGNSRSVIVIDYEETEIRDETGRNPESACTVVAVEA